MPNNKEQELREEIKLEFIKWYASQTGVLGVEQMANWWLQKRLSELRGIEAEILGMRKVVERHPNGEKTALGELDDEQNIGLYNASSILKKYYE